MEEKGKNPLADRMRPDRIEDVVGQEHLTGQDSALFKSLKGGRIFSFILWGPPGSGKTTLARLIPRYSQYPFHVFSAVTSGVKDLRRIIAQAEKHKALLGEPTILFVDEIHRFNKAQQDAFLPYVESGLIILVGSTTQNPSFEIIPPLVSRTQIMTLNPLGERALYSILTRAASDRERGLGVLKLDILPEAMEHIIHLSNGDARTALNNLERAAYYVRDGRCRNHPLDLHHVEKALMKKALPYDKDGEEHYNLISAFHKSMRGSDAQAALYWLYRMLMAGEDPLFIARRMIRFASEDIGLADPQALTLATTAFNAWQVVGPPEAELALAQAAAYLASAPKSNALYIAEKSVKQEIEFSGAQPVPYHIRNAPRELMKKLGYGQRYRYPHNYPNAWVNQEYLPKALKNRTFYKPTRRGFEKEILNRILDRKK